MRSFARRVAQNQARVVVLGKYSRRLLAAAGAKVVLWQSELRGAAAARESKRYIVLRKSKHARRAAGVVAGVFSCFNHQVRDASANIRALIC